MLQKISVVMAAEWKSAFKILESFKIVIVTINFYCIFDQINVLLIVL